MGGAEPVSSRAGALPTSGSARAAYAAMVSRLDREVGWILELLDRLGISDDTIVFFTSDNGGQGPDLPDSEFFRESAVEGS